MKRKLLAVIFVVYLLLVASVTIVPKQISRLPDQHADHINLVPLGYSFKCFQLDENQHPRVTRFCLRNTLGNIALFLPFGILLPALSGRFNSMKRVLLLAALLSLSIETIQFFSRFIGSPRAVDIDDVLLNTLGACLGLVAYRLVKGKMEKGEEGKG
jgi:glycopeptide antibiotics resistance protein